MTSPNHILQSAHRAYGAGAFARALKALEQIPEDARGNREYLLLYGACLARMRRGPEAVDRFAKLLAIDPDCHEALTWMAVLKRNPENIEEALGYARRAVALRPDDASGHGSLGSTYLSAQRPAEAIVAFERAVELVPDVAEHRHNLALAYLKAYRHDEGIAELREAIALAPRSPQNYLVLASTYAQFGMAGDAIECLLAGLDHLPDAAALHTALAQAFASIRNDEAAERHHRRALELSPEGRSGYATWLLNQGRFGEANTFLEEMLKDGSDPAFGSYGLMQSRKLTDSEADTAFVGEMEGRLRDPRLQPKGAMYLRYALGRAEEQRKRYGEAMAHFDEANRLAQRIYHAGRPLAPTRFAEENDQVRTLVEAMRDQPPASNPTESPIFIIGMIRSGTTLLDQIVSSHPAVASGGELRFWIEEGRRLAVQSAVPSDPQLRALAEEYVTYAQLLAGSAERITDKMPLNFAYAGLIHQALPNARFLHIRRHPIDIALSIWTTFFGQGPLFAYDKANIVAYYREYERSMAHWRATLPSDRLYELDYEALIADPSSVIPRVIEFLGLPWDDACLHHDQNQSAINTPSRWQARQPIYRTSVERWRRYEPWLSEFKDLEPATSDPLDEDR